MVATTWRETSIRPRSLAWISVLGGFPVRGGLAFVFESIRVLLCDADFAPIIRDDSGASKRSEEHTSELQSPCNLVCRLLLEKKKISNSINLCIWVRCVTSRQADVRNRVGSPCHFRRSESSHDLSSI